MACASKQAKHNVFLQVPVVSWFDDPSDRALLDLIPFFENLAKTDDIYVFLGNDNLPSSTTMYIGAITLNPVPPLTAVPAPTVPQMAPIFSSSVQSVEDPACDSEGS